MANEDPIKYSDLIVPDGSITDAIKQLEKLQVVYTNTQKSIRDEASKTEQILKQANVTQEEGRKATAKAASDADRLAKAQEQLDKATSDTAKQLAELKQRLKDANTETRLNTVISKAAEGSYDRLSAQYALNKKALNAMSAEQRKNTDTGKKLVAETKALYTEMKALQEETGKHTLSVGDYEKGWAGVKDQLSQIPGPASSVAGGFDSISASAKALLANPIVLTIAAIVGVLGLAYKGFKATATGANTLSDASSYLDGVMSGLVGEFNNLISSSSDANESLGESKSTWEKVGGWIKNFYTNSLNGAKKVGEGIVAQGKAIAELDFKKFANGFKDMADGSMQFLLGLSDDSLDSFIGRLNKAGEAMKLLNQERRAAMISNRELEKSVADLGIEEEKYSRIADDNTKSFKEREEAAKKLSQITIQRSAIERSVARTNLDLINKEIDLRRKNGEDIQELLDKQLDAYKTLRSAEREYISSVADNQKRESELKQDRLERDLDILIDGFDNQKTINERIIADDTRTLESRKALLEETRTLADDSFAKQIETIQQFTGIQINSNELIGESNAALLNEKIRSLGLSEIIEGRLLEIVRERRMVNQDLDEAEKGLESNRTERAKKAYEAQLKQYNEEYNLALSTIDLEKRTEAEKTKMKLQAEKERAQKVLEAKKAYGKDISDTEIQIAENTIKAIDAKLEAVKNNRDLDIYSVVGLKLSDEEKTAISDSTSFALEQLNSYLSAQVAASQKAVESSRSEVEAAQARLNAELEARNNGYASNVTDARRRLELAKKTQADALKNQEEAQKRQQDLQSLEQAGNLLSASAKIWGQLGFPWAIPAIAVMWGSFALSKVKARQAAKQSYGDGGLEFLQGGSHASGKDIPIGMTHDGKDRRAEGGEALAIINRKNTRKYRKVLPALIESLNKGTFSQNFANSYNDAGSINLQSTSIDMSRLEKSVDAIRDQNEKRVYSVNGYIITEYKNLKTITRGN